MTLALPNQSRTHGARGASPIRSGARRLAYALTTPLVPADVIDQVNPLLNPHVLRGRIETVSPQTPDSATVVIRPGRAWAGHRPGQYVRLGIDVEGVRSWRAYSITSPPSPGERRFSITVKAIPGGLVSNHLVRRARPGTIVELDQPTGDFVLPDPLPTKVAFLTAGSGITPIMGMLRSHNLSDVVVVHSAPTADDVIFGGELRALARAGRIRLVEHHTQTHGWLDPATLADLVPDIAERDTWACGPTALLDALEQQFQALGIPERLRTERFRPTLAATGEGGEVTFAGSGRTVEADGATPLLDVGEAAGVLLPSGCRMGICYGCVVPLESGTVRDLRSGTLTTAAPGDGVKVQTCINAAAGPCEISA